MTSKEIRAMIETIDPDPNRPEVATIREMRKAGYSSSQFVILREIAAQLAEFNEHARILADEARKDRELRNAQQQQIVDAQKALTENLKNGPPIPSGVIFAADPPAPPGSKVGEIIELLPGVFGEVCECGRIHQRQEEEAREKLARQNKERKPQ